VEIPDFDQLALNLVGWLLDRHNVPVDVQSKAQEQQAMAVQLRQVWNLRGAADCRAIDTRLSALTGWVTSEPYRKQLREAIEAADVPGP
jgi:hypothetical protein